jgi:hypothetical protein
MPEEFVTTKELKKLNKDLEKISKNLALAAVEVNPGILQELTTGAMDIRNTVITSMMSGNKTGHLYRRGKGGKMHRASAPGEAPAVDFGELARSIVFEVRSPLEVEVGSKGGAPYAPFLEFGVKDFDEGTEDEDSLWRLAPRPFLGPAITEHRDEILDNVGDMAIGVIADAIRGATR